MMRFFGTRIPARMFSQQRIIPKDIASLAEIIQREKMLKELQDGKLEFAVTDTMIKNYLAAGITEKQSKILVDAALATFLLHCEARIASSRGKGFYTIGPCGEEMLACIGVCLEETDTSALHYRHVAAEVARQLTAGVPIKNILLDRCRGYACSTHDPVTGGRHCAIGGSDFSYMVTSTLSSQAPPAVGRALAIPLARALGISTRFSPRAVSLVTVGDGSINNGHFLSAINLAAYAKHNRMKCPVVFGISDNGMCISLKGRQWVDHFVASSPLKSFVVDAQDIGDVMIKTKEALTYSRQLARPSIILYKNIRRRFGHAATDRQLAYLTQEEVDSAADHNNMTPFMATAVQAGHVSVSYIADRMEKIIDMVEEAFEVAVNEAKITDRATLVATNSQPLDLSNIRSHKPDVKGLGIEGLINYVDNDDKDKGKLVGKIAKGNSDLMRKHMNRCFDELLHKNHDMVYIGEDVEHGGYDFICILFPFNCVFI
jgi:TPP-dependent pyruvate/acetoin dehydrogenase alpha subunit